MAFLPTMLTRRRGRGRRRPGAGVLELEDHLGAADGIDDALFGARPEPMGRRAEDRWRDLGAVLLLAAAGAAVAVPMLRGAGVTAPRHPSPPAVAHTRVPAPVGCEPACEPAVVRSAIAQPLRLPTVGEAGRCPVSEVRRFPPGAGFQRSFIAAASGDLRLALVTRADGTVPLQGSSRIGVWHVRKVVWVFDPSYGGPALLRGARVDVPGELRFGHYLQGVGYDEPPRNGWPHPALLFVRGGLGAPPATGVTTYPSSIAVGRPGCYAIQVDGEGASDVLVFRVTRR